MGASVRSVMVTGSPQEGQRGRLAGSSGGSLAVWAPLLAEESLIAVTAFVDGVLAAERPGAGGGSVGGWGARDGVRRRQAAWRHAGVQ